MPKKCGIATFTHDLRKSVSNFIPHTECQIFAMNDKKEKISYPPEVVETIEKNQISDYIKKAELINKSNFDIVSLQHEYGIFGGKEGIYIIEFIKHLKVPIVPTFHTILKTPTATQKSVLKEIIALSSKIIVMSNTGKEILREIYGTPEEKIAIIPHGIPNSKQFFDGKIEGIPENKTKILTFGLLSPNKGIEFAIKAMAEVKKQRDDFIYIIAGQTHPNLVINGKDKYREYLTSLVKDNNLQDNVIFINKFLEEKDLVDYITSAEIYITPYLNEAQITSGTLAFAYGCGKAVISTPYWHASELLANGKGILVPFKNQSAIADSVIQLLESPERRKEIQTRAFMDGRSMLWQNTGGKYTYEYLKSCRSETFSTKKNKNESFPSINLTHFMELNDSTGMLQHGQFSFKDYNHGYCIDDNARALILNLELINKYGESHPEITKRLIDVSKNYASFINYAFNKENNHFRNFMNFSRQWLEDEGSQDSEGRTIWALGVAAKLPIDNNMSEWSKQLIRQVYKNVKSYNFLRSNAFAILGLCDYLSVFKDPEAKKILKLSSKKLHEAYISNRQEGWNWFDNELTYDNAALCQALIKAGNFLEEENYIKDGIEALSWLYKTTMRKGIFSPPGCKGFYKKGGEYPIFDQQPLEACSTISACIEAWKSTEDKLWTSRAMNVFSWFTGNNIIECPVFDMTNGGCHDGITETGLNRNIGAESTLSFLISQVKISEALTQQGENIAAQASCNEKSLSRSSK
ncbi:MAG: glycosyltransferase family 4 protein [Spirochaetales bacterium]|nr:glycosyltransferase family 4 protein [Spirochaetales bacterium]